MSVKAAPVIAVVFGLVIVIVSVDVPFNGMPVGENDLAMVGGSKTLSVALAAAVLEPPLVVSAPAGILFKYEPATVDVTLSVIIQVLPAGMVNPETANVPGFTALADGVKTGAPVQVVRVPGTMALRRSSG